MSTSLALFRLTTGASAARALRGSRRAVLGYDLRRGGCQSKARPRQLHALVRQARTPWLSLSPRGAMPGSAKQVHLPLRPRSVIAGRDIPPDQNPEPRSPEPNSAQGEEMHLVVERE